MATPPRLSPTTFSLRPPAPPLPPSVPPPLPPSSPPTHPPLFPRLFPPNTGGLHAFSLFKYGDGSTDPPTDGTMAPTNATAAPTDATAAPTDASAAPTMAPTTKPTDTECEGEPVEPWEQVRGVLRVSLFFRHFCVITSIIAVERTSGQPVCRVNIYLVGTGSYWY